MPSHSHRPTLPGVIAILLAMVLSAASALAQSGPGGPGAGDGPREAKNVGVVAAELSDVPQIVTLPGRAVAYETASVRPRVGGLIEAITYEPGRMIEAGAPMFRLEAAELDATLAAAQATEQGAIQARDNARAVVDRSTALENRGVTRAALELSQVALSQAEAALVTAQTARQTAELQRARAVINAPIAGYTSETTATIGSLVTADQAEALATVTRLDPIYVDVASASTTLLQSRQKIASGLMTPIDPPQLQLTLEDGSTYDPAGEVVSEGATVSATTGTVDLRLKFANPDRLILPGQFLRVQMTTGTIRAVLVPQRATSRLADGNLVAFVLQDGKAVRRVLTSSGVWNNSWAVIDGVAAGEQVIVDGLDNLEDGQTVAAVTVTLDARGVVVPPEGEAGQPWSPQPADAAAPKADAVAGGSKPGWFARLRNALGMGADGAAVAAEPSGAAAAQPRRGG